jgi:hypothetical protein
MFTLIGIIFLLAGGTLFFLSARTASRVAKYNFENRTDGGVIKHQNFNSAKRQAAKGLF